MCMDNFLALPRKNNNGRVRDNPSPCQTLLKCLVANCSKALPRKNNNGRVRDNPSPCQTLLKCLVANCSKAKESSPKPFCDPSGESWLEWSQLWSNGLQWLERSGAPQRARPWPSDAVGPPGAECFDHMPIPAFTHVHTLASWILPVPSAVLGESFEKNVGYKKSMAHRNVCELWTANQRKIEFARCINEWGKRLLSCRWQAMTSTAWKKKWMNAWTDDWMDDWMNEWVSGWMNERMNERMNDWLLIKIFFLFFSILLTCCSKVLNLLKFCFKRSWLTYVFPFSHLSMFSLDKIRFSLILT